MAGEGSRFGREWRARLRALLKLRKGISVCLNFGNGRRSTQVSGGVTSAQWLATLTGESPTSSASTPGAGVVRRVDKACPKRLVDAAEHKGSLELACLEDGSSSGVADGRERKTQRKGSRIGRTMRKVTTRKGAMPCRRPDLSRKTPWRGKKRSPRHVRHGNPAIRMTGKSGYGTWI